MHVVGSLRNKDNFDCHFELLTAANVSIANYHSVLSDLSSASSQVICYNIPGTAIGQDPTQT